MEAVPNKGLLGKEFKKDAKAIMESLKDGRGFTEFSRNCNEGKWVGS